MVRKIIEDIRPNNKKKTNPSLENDVVSSKLINLANDLEVVKKDIEEIEDETTNKINKKTRKSFKEYFANKRSKKQRLQSTPQIKAKSVLLHNSTLIFFILSIIVGGIYWGGDILQKVEITITPKHELITYKNKQFIASKNPDDNSINFEIMITSAEKTKNITLKESKNVSLKSQGSIILYNEFSANPQKIPAETFLSDNKGKAYKTDKSVTIPGYKLDKSKKIIPGQISVPITAFLPGEAYNGSPSDFYINSFKETTKYTKIYGKLENPLIGGASGLVYVVTDTDKQLIEKLAQTSFKEDMLRQVNALVPPGYILYPNASAFSYKAEENILSKTPNTAIKMNGTLAVVLLKEKSLIDNIMKISLPDIKGEELKEIKISDLDKLSFSFMNKEEVIAKDMDAISFLLSGEINAIWNPNIELLKTKLAGIHKNNVPYIFKQDPGITHASFKIYPPWQKYVPVDLSKINIIMK